MKIIDIIRRILGFPFFACLGLISALIMWVVWLINYIKFGGESIAYTEKTRKKMIYDVYVKLEESLNEKL